MKKFRLFVLIIGVAVLAHVGNAQTLMGTIGTYQGGAYFNSPQKVFVSGNNAFIMNGMQSSVIEIVDVSLPASPEHKGTYTSPFWATSIFAEANYLYVTTSVWFGGGSFQVVNVSNPTLPTLTSSYNLNSASLVSVSNGYAYLVTTGSTKLEIIDVSTPSNLVYKGSLSQSVGGATFSSAEDIQVFGDYAYIATSNGLEIVDVSNKANPLHKGFYAQTYGFEAVNIFYPYAYVSRIGASMQVLDISVPTDPSWVTTIGGIAASTISRAGNFLYSITQNGANPSGSSVYALDISIPSSPVGAFTYWDTTPSQYYRSVFASGNHIYKICDGFNGMKIINVSNPMNVYLESTIIHGAGGTFITNPSSVQVVNNKAYVTSTTNNALQIIDVSNPSSPTKMGNITDGAGGAVLLSPKSVGVSEPYAFVTTNNALEVINVSDPNHPVHQTTLANGTGGAVLGSPSHIFIDGTNAYVTVGSGLEVVDISNPIAPTHRGYIQHSPSGPWLNGANFVHVSGNYAYVTAGMCNALNIFDISNPTPVFISKINDGTIENPSSVYVTGNYAYITNEYSMTIVDISDKALPVQIGYSHNNNVIGPYLYFPKMVKVVGNYAYVPSLQSNSLEIIDVTNPSSPRHKGHFYYSPLLPSYLDVSGSYIHVVNYGNLNSSLTTIQFLPITISSFSPASGTPGSSVTITGTNFSPIPATNTVKFNGVAATVTASTSTSMTVIVPGGATNGEIVVGQTNQNQTGWSSTNFIVNPVVSFTSSNSGTFGGTIPLTITTGGSTGSVSYSVTNGTGSATISGNTLLLTGVGTVTVTATVASDANYGVGVGTQIITVNPIVATLSLSNLAQTYSTGSATVGVSTTPSGLATQVLYNGSSTPPVNCGSYSVVATITTPGYSGSINGTLVVSKANLSVTADAKTKSYGSSNPALTYIYSGLLGSDTPNLIDTAPTVSTSATTCSSTGSYTIAISGGSDNNYLINSYSNAALTITKATLIITADNKSKTYGAQNPILTYTFSGLVCSDTQSVIDSAPTISTTGVGFSNVGNYPITISGGSDNNYIFSFVSGTLSITKANQTITINPIPPLCGTSSVDLNSYATTSAAGLSVSFESSFPSTAYFSDGHTLVFNYVGAVTITATQAGNSNYNPAQAQTRDVNHSDGIGQIYQSGNICDGTVWLMAGPGSGYSWGPQLVSVNSPGSYIVYYYDVYGCYVSGTTIVDPCSGGGPWGHGGGPGVDDFRKAVTEADSTTDDPLAGRFEVYPNPVDKELNVHLQEPVKDKASIRLIDMLGREWVNHNLQIDEYEKVINTENLVSGTYLLQVVTEKGSRVRKIIVVHP